jgi:hypothetical protein
MLNYSEYMTDKLKFVMVHDSEKTKIENLSIY